LKFEQGKQENLNLRVRKSHDTEGKLHNEEFHILFSLPVFLAWQKQGGSQGWGM